jgi:hypothetical protein
MTPRLTTDDWHTLLVSIILVAVLPGWVVLILPFACVLMVVWFAGIFSRL